MTTKRELQLLIPEVGRRIRVTYHSGNEMEGVVLSVQKNFDYGADINLESFENPNAEEPYLGMIDYVGVRPNNTCTVVWWEYID